MRVVHSSLVRCASGSAVCSYRTRSDVFRPSLVLLRGHARPPVALSSAFGLSPYRRLLGSTTLMGGGRAPRSSTSACSVEVVVPRLLEGSLEAGLGLATSLAGRGWEAREIWDRRIRHGGGYESIRSAARGFFCTVRRSAVSSLFADDSALPDLVRVGSRLMSARAPVVIRPCGAGCWRAACRLFVSLFFFAFVCCEPFQGLPIGLA